MYICYVYIEYRVSGVTDHFAVDDRHALQITRSVVANLKWSKTTSNSFFEQQAHLQQVKKNIYIYI